MAALSLVIRASEPPGGDGADRINYYCRFVALYKFTGYVVFIITSFLAGVEFGDQCLLNSEVLSCFPGFHNEYKIVFLFQSLFFSKIVTHRLKSTMEILSMAFLGNFFIERHC